MSSRRRIAKAIQAHKNDLLKKDVQTKTYMSIPPTSATLTSENTTVNNSTKKKFNDSSAGVESTANIKLAAAVWKRMREEEERKKLEKKGVKRKRPKLKNRFKRNAKNEQKLLKIQRRNLLRYKQLDMKTIWNEGRQYNTWNVTEIFKNFLYLGAGTDISKRCLLNMPNDSNILKAEKMAFYYHNNIRYILNMSGSPLQKELNGHTYPVDITFFHVLPKLIPMNDIDTIDETMVKMFDYGAAYIEKAFQAHLKYITKSSQLSTSSSSSTNNNDTDKNNDGQYNKAPMILIHCVAGVHRSPMVVVWWMVKYHGWIPEQAWTLVRERRDASCVVNPATNQTWKDVTLGGGYLSGKKKLWFNAINSYYKSECKGDVCE